MTFSLKPISRRGALSRWVLLLGAAAAAGPAGAGESLYLELSARGEKMDLGLSAVATEKGLENGAAQAADVEATLKNDLAFTGLFSLIEGGPRYEGPAQAAAWSRLGADVVSAGKLEKTLFGRPQLAAVLGDANTGQVLLAKKISLDEGARRAAHLWADELVRYFTGQPGVAASRIVFVNDATGKKEVCVVDADGSNFHRLTDDRSIALFPKLSPDGNWIVFTTYRGGRPEIYLMRSDGREARPLCAYEGLNSAAAWMPDGKSVVVTLSRGRVPNLCVVDLEGRVIQTLTNSPAADTAPTVSPDGLSLAFTSDRPGLPQLYMMGTNGADLRRMLKGPLADSPHWSPVGPLLVFTMQEKNYFDLWTLEVATGKASRLTYGEGDNENASWSPDGRHIVFTSTRGGRRALWVMGADGSSPRPLGPLPGRSFTPHWGR